MRSALLGCLLLCACLPTKYEPYPCNSDSDCLAKAGVTQGLRCDLDQHVCVCDGLGAPGCETYADAGSKPDSSDDVAAPPVDTVGVVEAGGVEASGVDAADVAQADEPVMVDAQGVDGPGTCGASVHCQEPGKGFCVAGVCAGCHVAGVGACAAPTPTCDATTGRCVGCTQDSQCTAEVGKEFCVAGACVGCRSAGVGACGARSAGKPVCATSGALAGQCVECGADGDCPSAEKSFCVGNACVGCQGAGASACSARSAAKPVCATSGSSAGQCVECGGDADCPTAGKSFCVGNVCGGCQGAGADACSTRSAGKPVCATSGSSAGQCVECGGDGDCTSAAKSFCVSNACTGCQGAGESACSTRSAAKPACAVTGTLAGQCVECNTSAECAAVGKPICTANACAACTADSECAAKLGTNPGVCLGHLGGRCATDADTIYAGSIGTAACSDSAANAGSVQAPYCSARLAVGAAKAKSRPVVVLTGPLAASSPAITANLSLVGKSGAVITPEPFTDALTITSGEVYLRNLTIKGSASSSTGIGIHAAPISGSTVTLHMERCAVRDNSGGGILLNGAGFDLKNTQVTGNGPGTFGGSTSWGGILVNNPPSSGLRSLGLLSIQTNDGGGLSCTSGIQGTGVLSQGNTNTVGQIGTACAVTACTPASATCGAQSSPQ